MKTKTAVSLSLFLVTPLTLPLSLPVAQAQSAQTLTLTGDIVGRRDADEVWLRSYDRYYRVAGKAPFAIANGDRIRVSGAWKNGVLTGYSWKSVKALNGKVTPNFTISGAVYRDLPGDEFQVKSLGGSIYRVLPVKEKAAGLSRGDLVSVVGKREKGVVLATQVMITAQRQAIGTAPTYEPQQAVVGAVASNPRGNIFEIQAGGRQDRVLSLFGDNPNVKAGQRVRIWAFWDSAQGLWQASNLRVLNGKSSGIGSAPNVSKPYGPNYRPRVLSGNIVAGGGSKWTVRAGDTNYPIQLLVAKPALLTVGSKVKLTGSWSNKMMRVSKIEMR